MRSGRGPKRFSIFSIFLILKFEKHIAKIRFWLQNLIFGLKILLFVAFTFGVTELPGEVCQTERAHMVGPLVMLCGCASPVIESCAGGDFGRPTCGREGVLRCSPGASYGLGPGTSYGRVPHKSAPEGVSNCVVGPGDSLPCSTSCSHIA